MRDLLTAGVRTAVQAGVAAAVGWLAKVGIDVDAQAFEAVVFALASGVVAILLNWLGSKFPVVNRITSLGLSTSSANYS